jgi:hypothetical protein
MPWLEDHSHSLTNFSSKLTQIQFRSLIVPARLLLVPPMTPWLHDLRRHRLAYSFLPVLSFQRTIELTLYGTFTPLTMRSKANLLMVAPFIAKNVKRKSRLSLVSSNQKTLFI